VRTKPPPPSSIGIESPIKTLFLALNPQYPEMLSHRLVIVTIGSRPSSSPSSTLFLPSASSPGVRVSNSFFFIRGAFSLEGCLLPFFRQAKTVFQLSFFE
jgi:hypothetical protein